MRILFLLFLLVISSFGKEKLIILHFINEKPFYFHNQIVNIKLKALTGENGNFSIFSDQNNTTINTTTDNNITYISNITFQLKDNFPMFQAYLRDKNGTLLDEENITLNAQIKQLNPPKNFCGVLANDMNISEKVLSPYDDTQNIIYWTLETDNGNLNDFKTNFKSAKLYFVEQNATYSKYSYSALVPKNIRNFNIIFYNTKINSYQDIKFTMHLRNEMVSTQTDIKPIDKTNLYVINLILVVLLLLWGVLFFYKRKKTYIFLIILDLLILFILNKPKPQIILPKGTKIQILPFKNSTVFSVLGMNTKVIVLNNKAGYLKVKFNNHIGWVKNEKN